MFRFLNPLLRKKKVRATRVRRKGARRSDVLHEFVNELGLRSGLDRRELESMVRELELYEEDVEPHGLNGSEGAARNVVARNGIVECALCEWPAQSEVFSIVQARGTEVLRVWSGKVVLTEHYYVNGKMKPYCVAELHEGSVVSLPPAVVYGIQNRNEERARTLHFLSPPPTIMPDSEGVRKMCKQGRFSLV
ncbi:hypothetical protein DRN67_02585 [Candidatus Micrarchaeota archaeon]|nr:MAG: hypothetical protein DRN67_02585 [Candidatus Micrarchaeota archaeon]